MSSTLLDDLREDRGKVADPIKMGKLLWPHVVFYRQQREIIYSVMYDDETYVPAGNKLGKDFVAGFVALWFFLTRHPCRVVTTSAKDDHLRVLWGEIGRFVQTCKYKLDAKYGGPLLVNHQDIRKVVNGEKCPISYMTGLVAGADSMAAMQGHHVARTGDGIPRALFMSDESSSVPDDYHKMASTWMDRALIFGNTWECSNFFYRGVKAGDLYSEGEDSEGRRRCYRKVIKIKAEDSPNVRYALAEIAAGKKPSNKIIVPGVKAYDDYVKHRKVWDPIQQCVSLDAEFYEGAEIRLFPREWIQRSVRLNNFLAGKGRRKAKAIGIDPAEGGDKTSASVVDEMGLIKLVSKKTPNTQDIIQLALDLIREYDVRPDRVVFDRGGGGKQLADQLRAMGYAVRTVAFGEMVQEDPKGKASSVSERMETKEDRYAYKNRRAQMYGELSLLMDPSLGEGTDEDGEPTNTALTIFRALAGLAGKDVRAVNGFALKPEEVGPQYKELLFQLSKIPKKYDREGQLILPPKNRTAKGSKEVTLVDMIGHSPDEADSLVLAVHGMLHAPKTPKAGMIGYG